MNLAMKKRERITTGGKGKGKITSEIGNVTGKIVDAPNTDSLGKKV